MPWAKPARAAGTRVAGSVWFVPVAARESASAVITSTWAALLTYRSLTRPFRPDYRLFAAVRHMIVEF